ncbi:hypothetical protein G7Y79_00021g050950 [Physcia stellaris]|nr:hypothetical protein G7Y79_00021g050950 [Physcia stellaris]
MTFLEQRYQHIKNTVHGLQGLSVLVAWIITIAVFTRPGRSGGQTRYFFALCWITIPILIYQTAVPTFNRTKRFSNAYAHAALDVLFTILWLAAFAAVAAWTNQGISKVKDRKDNEKGCDKFAFGSTGKCKLSQGSIGNIRPLNLRPPPLPPPRLPARQLLLPAGAVPITDHAFSSNPHDDDYEADELHNADDHHPAQYDPPIGRDDDEYQSIHTDTEEGTHPGRPLSWGQQAHHQQQHEDTSYHGAYNSHSQYPRQRKTPSATRRPIGSRVRRRSSRRLVGAGIRSGMILR